MDTTPASTFARTSLTVAGRAMTLEFGCTTCRMIFVPPPPPLAAAAPTPPPTRAPITAATTGISQGRGGLGSGVPPGTNATGGGGGGGPGGVPDGSVGAGPGVLG